MPVVNLLSDVDPTAITICKTGANRQRIFLRKTAPDEMVTLPAPASAIIRKADGDGWSVFYCVVAEPGAQEGAGLVGDQEIPDEWASPDEIRKAAHRLLKNKGYVNAMHDAMEEQGCHIVENAVALADMEILGPDGVVTTIKKDSWYIGIEPSDEFKAGVESGEIEGVSLEGTGIRTQIEKEGKPATRKSRIQRALKALTDLVGEDLSEVDVGEPIAKSAPATFDEFHAASKIREEMPCAIWALEDAIYATLDPAADVPDRMATLSSSLTQFSEWAQRMLEGLSAEQATSLQKQMATLRETRPSQEDDEVPITDEQFEAVKKNADEAVAGVGRIETLLKEKFGEPEPEGDKSNDGGDGGDESVETRLAKAEAVIAKLSEGGSAQPADGDLSYEEIKKIDPDVAYTHALLS